MKDWRELVGWLAVEIENKLLFDKLNIYCETKNYKERVLTVLQTTTKRPGLCSVWRWGSQIIVYPTQKLKCPIAIIKIFSGAGKSHWLDTVRPSKSMEPDSSISEQWVNILQWTDFCWGDLKETWFVSFDNFLAPRHWLRTMKPSVLSSDDKTPDI